MTPAATDVPATVRYLRPSLGTELRSFPHHDAGCMPCAPKTGLQSKFITGPSIHLHLDCARCRPQGVV